MSNFFSGVWTALATPFQNGSVDQNAFQRLIESQIRGKISGLVVCGTTGESATLTREERLDLIEQCVSFAQGRIPVMAGTGSPSTAESIAFTQEACKRGVDSCLVVTPAYNKPSQAGMVEHFVKIADASSVPVMLYNVPGRTASNLLPESVQAIVRRNDQVKGIKEASGDLEQMTLIKRVAPDISVLSGDDALFLPALAIGASGVVSVASNAAPKLLVDLMQAFQDKDLPEAQALHQKLLPLVELLFAESNPTPVKYALMRMGIGDGSIRLPLLQASTELAEKLEGKLIELGVL